MMDMLSKVLKSKLAKSPMKIEIHVGQNDEEMKKGTDLAPEVKDNGDDQEMNLLQSLTHGDDMDPRPVDRKPTFEEKAKTKMKSRIAEIKNKNLKK